MDEITGKEAFLRRTAATAALCRLHSGELHSDHQARDRLMDPILSTAASRTAPQRPRIEVHLPAKYPKPIGIELHRAGEALVVDNH